MNKSTKHYLRRFVNSDYYKKNCGHLDDFEEYLNYIKINEQKINNIFSDIEYGMEKGEYRGPYIIDSHKIFSDKPYKNIADDSILEQLIVWLEKRGYYEILEKISEIRKDKIDE